MMISQSHGFLFVHIPKTGGTSVEAALRPEGRAVRPKHIPASHIVTKIGVAAYSKLETFTVVRDPLTKFVSYYSHLKTKSHRRPVVDTWSGLEDFIDVLEGQDPVWNGVRSRALPQVAFLAVNRRIAVKTVLRF